MKKFALAVTLALLSPTALAQGVVKPFAGSATKYTATAAAGQPGFACENFQCILRLEPGGTQDISAGYGGITVNSNIVLSNETLGTKTLGSTSHPWQALVLGADAAAPACSADERGKIYITRGAAGVKDAVQVCAKDVSNNYAWRTLY
jgi:hypothetical protein